MSQVEMNRLMRTALAADYLGVSGSYLAKLRVFGGGPAFHKIGARVVYDRRDLDSWRKARVRNSTSE